MNTRSHVPGSTTLIHTIRVVSILSMVVTSWHPVGLFAGDNDMTIVSESHDISAHIPGGEHNIATITPLPQRDSINQKSQLVKTEKAANTQKQTTSILQAPSSHPELSKTLPMRSYEDMFSVGDPDYHITFHRPVTIQSATTLPEHTPITILTSPDGVDWSVHTYTQVDNGKIIFQTDHFTYFASSSMSGDMIINNDNTRTQTAAVTIQNNILGAVSMKFGNTPTERDTSSREPYAPTKSRTLPGSPGNHTVYAAFQNAAGDIVTLSDDIIWSSTVSSFDTAGLSMRYDATDPSTIIEAGGLITQRQDKSGNSNHANSTTSTSQPHRSLDTDAGVNVVDFDGTNDFLAIENIFYNSQSIDGVFICTVFKTDYNASTTYNANRSFIDFDRSDFYNFYIQGNGKLELSYTAGTTIDAPVTNGGIYNDNKRHYACGRYDSSVVNDTEIYVDGAREYVADRRATGTPIGKTSTRYGFIGDGSEATSYNASKNNVFYDGKIGEIIVFDDIATLSQRQDVMCYLSTKRGIGDACDDPHNPIASISYNTTTPTTSFVSATLTNPSESITITNNGGVDTYLFTENGSFTFEYIDAQGNIGSTTATVSWIQGSAQIGGTDIVAGGYISDVDTVWKTVLFDRSYTTPPIIIATPTTASNGDNSPLVRLRNITTESFQISLCLDNGTSTCAAGAPEDVSYTLRDRDLIAANPHIDAGILSTATDGNDTSLSFNKTLSYNPYVFLSSQSSNQGSGVPATAWAKDISTSSATIIGCVHDGSGDDCQTSASNENIGYIAFDPVLFYVDSLEKGSADISSSTRTQATYGPYATNPLINIVVNSETGAQDPVYPQANNVTTSSASYRYCEQDGNNDCDTHNAEDTRWLTIQDPDDPQISIDSPTVLTLSGTTQNYDQTITQSFSGYFATKDDSGYNVGRYTTISISDLHGPSLTIDSSDIRFQVASVTTLSGDTNPSIISPITSWSDITSPLTLLQRPTGPNSLKTGTYGVTPELQIDIPAYAPPGVYTGTITHTLYEYSDIQ